MLAVASLSRHWQCCKICLCVCVCVCVRVCFMNSQNHTLWIIMTWWYNNYTPKHTLHKKRSSCTLCLWIWCRFHCTFFCEAFPWSAPSELNCWWSISCHTNTTFSHFVRSEWVKPLPCPPTCCWVLLYVHRNHRFIRDGSPRWPHQLSHSSWALRINIRSLVNVI